ncbi:hypothetical protein F2P81_010679 [Scophthalmus maximus]|uniref:Ral guanine nucleotide dissociation stimulator-like 1 n=1 Tax=Scophthalmus maximus TaxID=52904 RepID=A0A6A4SYE8_SCOMX|nr:hypothetical protein F2P81_010679 [Scophthalmus maximus]
MGRMRQLLWLRPNPCMEVHMHSEPGVWLRSFQLIDTDAQYELLTTLRSPPQDPVQEWGEEEEDGAVFGITLRREPVLPSADAAELPASVNFAQYHTVKVRRLKAATLERLVTHLLDREHQEPDFIRVFLSTYRAFTSTSTLIELLFQREDSIASCDNGVCPLSTLPPVIRLWLKHYREDFHEPPQYQALRLMCAHLRHRLCFRRLAQTAENLLKQLQEQDCSRSASEHVGKSSQPEPRDEEDGGDTSAKEEDKYSFMDFPVRGIAEQLTRLDSDLFVRVVPFHCLGCVWSQRDKKENRNLAPTVRATISQFNAVTNRVITSLLCPPSPSSSTSSLDSSPVSSSNFLYPSTAPSSPRCSHASPAHRARIIERWIAIAQVRGGKSFQVGDINDGNFLLKSIANPFCVSDMQECRQLKNFSSLRAILSALQSNAVYRLKKTWAAVSREITAAFDHLCETFPDENCVLTTREILVEKCCSINTDNVVIHSLQDDSQPDSSATTGSKSPRLCSASRQMNLRSGIVPYLGTYLTVLTMLDTALTDTVDGGLVNFEKRRREFEILSQIRQLQTSCSHYSLPVDPRITAWLQAHTLLTDQESYELSRDLEPPVDPCPSSPNLWSSRLLTKKLATLSSSSCSSSNPDLSSSSLALSPESSSTSGCSSQASLPVYNKQVADSCIIRVSVECVSNGNVYKSILLTSQDHTPQVIQRAIEKHNMEDVTCHDFSLYQMFSTGKELQIPDKANVFYAMCTTANYDFVLRRHWRSHGRHLGSSLSPGAPAKGRHGK